MRRPLALRFAEQVRAAGLEDGEAVVVALSGGVDSVVLLHLLRAAPGVPRLRLVAAHVDHAMRPGSSEDAAWVRELAAGWDVELRSTRLDPAPRGEAEARRRRYGFLEDVRRELGARAVLTAHHADDQAETVLFRALRGSGIAGLRGVHAWRAPAVWRPLLPWRRAELLAYAREEGLSWREDPTNEEPFARNVLRHRVLPELESSVAPGARRSLVRLAAHARENEAAWRSLVPELLARVDARTVEGGTSFDRERLLALHPAVRARLLRALAGRLGVRPRESGTRLAVEFTSSGESGGVVSLGEGLTLSRELDRLVLVRRPPAGPDIPVRIDGPGPGEGSARLGGASYGVRWSCGGSGALGDRERFAVGELSFPLMVRAWAPGDRARLEYGSKKLKKLFLEARVPSRQRHRKPVVVDASGAVLWVPGVVRSADAPPGEDGEVLYIGITHADSD